MNINSVFQRILSRNKATITYLSAELLRQKGNKTRADIFGDVQSEYEFHEDVKALRAALKNYVNEQQLIKKLLKGN